MADEDTTTQELTRPRDTLPEDPSSTVAHPEFPVSRRGYDRAAVDAYVQRVVRLVEQLDAVRSPRSAVREALERVGAETSGILAQAHATAEEVTRTARAEAEDLTVRSRREAEERLERSRAEAEEIVRGGRERARTLDEDADQIWDERARLLADVEQIAVDLGRVMTGAHQRFPGEDESATPGTPARPAEAEARPEDEEGEAPPA